jgi:hypothetical protein
MSTVSLQEAADKLGASKADVWRAIRAGSLSAQRTGDGGFAIDSDELFRVFERPSPAQPPMQPHATASPPAQPDATASSPPMQSDATASPAPAPETSAKKQTAEMDEMAVAFAALQAELKGLLGPLAGGPASERRGVEDETGRAADPLVAALERPALRDEAAGAKGKGEIDETKTEPPVPAPTAEKDAGPPLKRPWWKRLAS